MEPIELRSPVTLGAQRQNKLQGAQVVPGAPGAQTMNCYFANRFFGTSLSGFC